MQCDALQCDECSPRELISFQSIASLFLSFSPSLPLSRSLAKEWNFLAGIFHFLSLTALIIDCSHWSGLFSFIINWLSTPIISLSNLNTDNENVKMCTFYLLPSTLDGPLHFRLQMEHKRKAATPLLAVSHSTQSRAWEPPLERKMNLKIISETATHYLLFIAV